MCLYIIYKDTSFSQCPYVLQLLSNVDYHGCKTKKTPMDPNVILSQDEGESYSLIYLDIED